MQQVQAQVAGAEHVLARPEVSCRVDWQRCLATGKEVVCVAGVGGPGQRAGNRVLVADARAG